MFQAVAAAAAHGCYQERNRRRSTESMKIDVRKQGGLFMRTASLTLLVLVVGVALAFSQARKVDFTQDTVDQPPKGFELGHTAKVGRPGRWLVQAEGDN